MKILDAIYKIIVLVILVLLTFNLIGLKREIKAIRSHNIATENTMELKSLIFEEQLTKVIALLNRRK